MGRARSPKRPVTPPRSSRSLTTSDFGFGHCGATKRGRPSCGRASMGSFPLSIPFADNYSIAMHACLALCERCRGCNFVSVSTVHSDCSWYRSCDRLDTSIAGFISARAHDQRTGASVAANRSLAVLVERMDSMANAEHAAHRRQKERIEQRLLSLDAAVVHAERRHSPAVDAASPVQGAHHPLLALGVLSLAGASGPRQYIRTTLRAYSGATPNPVGSLIYRFVMGTSRLTATATQPLADEQAEHSDLVWLALPRPRDRRATAVRPPCDRRVRPPRATAACGRRVWPPRVAAACDRRATLVLLSRLPMISP